MLTCQYIVTYKWTEVKSEYKYGKGTWYFSVWCRKAGKASVSNSANRINQGGEEEGGGIYNRGARKKK